MNANDLRVEEQAASYLVAPLLTDHLDTFASAPEGFKRLRELVLNLAVRGMLVPQEANDEPATELLKRIARDRAGVDAEGIDERPFGVPNNWTWVRLGDTVEVLDSLRRPVTKDKRKPGPYPYYGASGIVDYVSDFLFDEDLVLVGEDGAKWSAGDQTAFAISGKTWVNNHAHVLRPNRTLLSDNYLIRALVALDLQPFITGTTVPKLNQAKLVSIEIPLPPLAEQSRIVAKVEELMALIDALEAKVGAGETACGKLLDTLLAALADSPDAAATAEAWTQLAPHFDLLLQTPADVDRLQQTLLQLAVKGRLVPQDPKDEPAAALLQRIRAEKERLIAEGKIKREKPLPAIGEDEIPYPLPQVWTWVRVPAVADTRLGKMLDKAKNRGHLKPYLRNTNVQWFRFDLSDIKELRLEDNELTEFRVLPGDLLICEGGEPGRCAIWRDGEREIYFQKALHRVRTYCGVMPEFLQLCLSADCANGWLGQFFTGATIKHFPGQQLESYCVPLPPLPEQSRIVAAVAALTALCDRLRERLAARRALSGKLTAALTESALA